MEDFRFSRSKEYLSSDRSPAETYSFGELDPDELCSVAKAGPAKAGILNELSHEEGNLSPELSLGKFDMFGELNPFEVDLCPKVGLTKAGFPGEPGPGEVGSLEEGSFVEAGFLLKNDPVKITFLGKNHKRKIAWPFLPV